MRDLGIGAGDLGLSRVGALTLIYLSSGGFCETVDYVVLFSIRGITWFCRGVNRKCGDFVFLPLKQGGGRWDPRG